VTRPWVRPTARVVVLDPAGKSTGDLAGRLPELSAGPWTGPPRIVA